MLLNPQVASRFWQKVKKTDGCWLWTAGRSSNGYGQFWLNGLTITAQRVSYMLSKGEIPANMVVRHKCDNPQCVRPDHLELGTQLQNMLDKMARGRCIRGNQHYARLSPEKLARGENHPRATVTTETVIEIRRLFATEKITVSELARHFGVGRKATEAIVKRKSWTHIEDSYEPNSSLAR